MGKKRSNPYSKSGKSTKSTFGGLGGVLAMLKGASERDEQNEVNEGNGGNEVNEWENGVEEKDKDQFTGKNDGGMEKEKDEVVNVVKDDRDGDEEEERAVKRRRVEREVEVQVNTEEPSANISAGAVLRPSTSTSTAASIDGVVMSRKIVKKKKRPHNHGLRDEASVGWEGGAGTGGWIEKYDMSGSVKHLASLEEEEVRGKGKGKGKRKGEGKASGNDALKKYFYQRYKLFSLYSTPPGCLLDEEGWYSVTPEAIGARIADRCRCDTILDAFCGVGGNAIQFALRCNRVIAMDTNATRLALARHNAMIYGVEERIEFVLGDYVQFAKGFPEKWKDKAKDKRKIDVVFLSPPWGGPDYLDGDGVATPGEKEDQHALYSLSSIQPIHGAELFKASRDITPNVAYYLPRNMDLDEVGKLVGLDEGYVEIEEEWTGTKLKALTCYFGGLVAGQESLW